MELTVSDCKGNAFSDNTKPAVHFKTEISHMR